MFFLRPAGRALLWTLLTALTALFSRWLGGAVESFPRSRQPGPSAACHPAAARDEQRLADSPLWRFVEARLVEHVLRPFKQHPTFQRLSILNVDFGPGGIASALRARAPLDSTVIATDSVAGMGDLARHRALRRRQRLEPAFIQSWSHGLPFRDSSFDLVVSSGALHSWPYPESTLSEIGRVVKPDGRYLVADLRRDMPLWRWLLVQLGQALVAPKDLRALGEPGASIRAAYAPHEAEWLGARASLPDLRVSAGPAWIMMESGGAAAPQTYSLN
ncbi:MAG: class I SAM-dependent methyltransferase [Chloroflexota bacterium]